jgi:hypothetical protein
MGALDIAKTLRNSQLEESLNEITSEGAMKARAAVAPKRGALACQGGLAHSKTWRQFDGPRGREASWSAAVLCRFDDAHPNDDV